MSQMGEWSVNKAILAGILVALSLPTAARSQTSQQLPPADAPAIAGDPSWLVWHTDDFFASCEGECSVALYGGREIRTQMTSAFLIRNPVAPWNWQAGDAEDLAGAFSRRFATLFGALDLEAEAGIEQRFGNMHATVGWLAVDFRWTDFPWNRYLATTIALADGPSYASQIDEEERLRSGDNRGSNLLNFFSPEITFALPDRPDDQLMLRFQHRSGIFGLINGVEGGSSFAVIGYRRAF